MRTRTRLTLAGTSVGLLSLAVGALPASAATSDTELSAAYNKGAVIVASGASDHLVDSVSAGPLASALTTSVLLSEPTALGESARGRLAEMNPSVVYVIGGTSAVPAQAETDIKAALPSATVVRLEGSSRYATANAVSVKVQDFWNWYFTQKS